MKLLVVITLLAFGCSLATAQTFGFESGPGGQGLYCNYEQLSLYQGGVWAGTDNLSPCGQSHNATIVGIKSTLPAAGNPLGFKVKGVAYADNIYDAFSGAYTGAQWFMVSNLKSSEKVYGWIAFASMSGVIFGQNYGYLTSYIPGKNANPSKGPTIGTVKALAGR